MSRRRPTIIRGAVHTPHEMRVRNLTTFEYRNYDDAVCVVLSANAAGTRVFAYGWNTRRGTYGGDYCREVHSPADIGAVVKAVRRMAVAP